MVVAKFGNFPLEEFFEVDESLRGDAGVPKVDFSSMSGSTQAAPPAEPPPAAPMTTGGGDAPPPPPA
jgi:hypothetical protein